MEVTTAADQLFFVTTYLAATSNEGEEWAGTGFVYGVETEKGTAHFLVTNKHVVEGASTLLVRMIRGMNGKPVLGSGSQITVNKFNPDYWRAHPDPRVDVAVMPLWDVLHRMEEIGAPPFFRSVAPEMCLTPTSAKELDAIEDVTFVGYPSGLYDAANLLPVARRGTTATPPVVDYEGLPAFLIDASVFPGSSGSPVFIADKGLRVDRTGNVVLGSPRLICLGVLAAVHVRPVKGKVVELPAKLEVSFDEPIDLGIVYKSNAIDECTDLVLGAAGVERVAAPTSAVGTPTEADEEISSESPPIENS